MQELIDVVKAVTGAIVPVVIGPRRSGDPARLAGDGQRIRREPEWPPDIADLKSIVKTAWAWHKKKDLVSRIDEQTVRAIRTTGLFSRT